MNGLVVSKETRGYYLGDFFLFKVASESLKFLHIKNFSIFFEEGQKFILDYRVSDVYI